MHFTSPTTSGLHTVGEEKLEHNVLVKVTVLSVLQPTEVPFFLIQKCQEIACSAH